MIVLLIAVITLIICINFAWDSGLFHRYQISYDIAVLELLNIMDINQAYMFMMRPIDYFNYRTPAQVIQEENELGLEKVLLLIQHMDSN